LHLKYSPLVFVLAQVKIAPILQMPQYVPEIQEGLRRSGFPGYEPRTTQKILIGPGRPQATEAEHWFFTNRESTCAAILGNDFVVLAASVYDRFEEFAATLEGILGIVKTACSPGFSSRLGLRYVDLIKIVEGQALDSYLQPGLRGLEPEQLGASSLLHHMRLRAETSAGILSVRIWQNRDGRVLPPDLAADELPFRFEVPDRGELLTILDIDHFSERRREFEPSSLIQEIWSLHEGTDRAFRSAVTPEAMELWGDTTT
jgi:uncharacterized protein (TIGR04255 family)